MAIAKSNEKPGVDKASMVKTSSKNESDLDVIKLKHPFDFEGEKIESVTLRRLKAKDVVAVEQEISASGIQNPGQATNMLFTVARSTGLVPEVIQEMDMEDYLDLAVKVDDFL